jgi:hypothetical protein
VSDVHLLLFSLLVTGFPWETEEFTSQRGGEHLGRTLLSVWCKDRDRNGSEDGACDCRHVCQVWSTWGVPCEKPNAPPRVTDAKTGGAARRPIFLSLLEPLLLSLDKNDPTEDLVVCSLVDEARLVASSDVW